MTTAERPIWVTYDSPLGPLTLLTGPKGISRLCFDESAKRAFSVERFESQSARQLEGYFARSRKVFDLDLDPRGTALQRRVWELLTEVPYGMTATFAELAARIDDSLYPADVKQLQRPRTVGAAVGQNPIPILIPCHRVIGADGSLTGYVGGLERKRALLDLEGASPGQRSLPDRTEPRVRLTSVGSGPIMLRSPRGA